MVESLKPFVTAEPSRGAKEWIECSHLWVDTQRQKPSNKVLDSSKRSCGGSPFPVATSNITDPNGKTDARHNRLPSDLMKQQKPRVDTAHSSLFTSLQLGGKGRRSNLKLYNSGFFPCSSSQRSRDHQGISRRMERIV